MTIFIRPLEAVVGVTTLPLDVLTVVVKAASALPTER